MPKKARTSSAKNHKKAPVALDGYREKGPPRTSQAESLRGVLEKEIFLGRLPPGEKLDEVALADRFGVSRTPVREALLLLSSAGLVEMSFGRGASVAALSIPRILEMLDVLAHLEELSMSLAAVNISPAGLARLSSLHQRCRKLATDHRIDDYYELARGFHETIYEGSGNGFLFEETRNLRNIVFPYLRHQLHRPGRVEACIDEQQAIFDAIRTKNSAAAAAAAKAHLKVQASVFRAFVDALDGTGLAAAVLNWPQVRSSPPKRSSLASQPRRQPGRPHP
jgi:DNA-binding GntR family transcriptional regulator